jgi:hypothetical protein
MEPTDHLDCATSKTSREPRSGGWLIVDQLFGHLRFASKSRPFSNFLDRAGWRPLALEGRLCGSQGQSWGQFQAAPLSSRVESRLVVMRRLAAFALVQGLVASAAMGPFLHVHEYRGHDHPDHHHGPASHEHHHSAAADHDRHSDHEDKDQPGLSAESCDPGRHAVAVTMGCAQVPQLQVDIAELPAPSVLVPAAPVGSAVAVTDVRVHGPQFDARIPSRAPPLTRLA